MTIEGEVEAVEHNWGELVLSITEEAKRRFFECGAGGDFCIQHCTGESIVFGGTNRVTWTAKRGFVPDAYCCTKRFLKEWKKVYAVQ